MNDVDVSLRFLDGRTVGPLLGDTPDRLNTVEHLRVPVGQPGGAALLQVRLRVERLREIREVPLNSVF